MENLPLISIILFLPLFSALSIIIFVGHVQYKERDDHAIFMAIFSALLTFVATIFLIINFDSNNPDYQFVEHYKWLNDMGLEFIIGVDGISILFVALTSLLVLICMVISFFTIKHQIKEFLLCFLLFECFCIGAFCSINLLLFFFFFEVILIPMYLIIGIWGGQMRMQAALKFFIFTFLGSICFLAAIIYLYSQTQTFDLRILGDAVSTLSPLCQNTLWLAIFIGFAVKVPMLPFHTWLPEAHVEAPTAGSVVLAGILLKLGAYGFIRILMPLFPDSNIFYSNYVIALSAIAVIYASLVAYAQTDMKKMIAYSSIAHMGYVTAGIFSLNREGLEGAMFQMISHGIISPALFIAVGILYERGHSKNIDIFGGVASKMPHFAVLFMIATLGSIGLPTTSGFVGEFLSLIGIFKANNIFAVIIGCGIVGGAIYMLSLYRRLMLGQENNMTREFKDLTLAEYTAILPLSALIIYLGIFPMNVIGKFQPTLDKLLMLYIN